MVCLPVPPLPQGCNCYALNILARSAHKGKRPVQRISRQPFAFYTRLRPSQTFEPPKQFLDCIFAEAARKRTLVSTYGAPARAQREEIWCTHQLRRETCAERAVRRYAYVDTHLAL